MLRRCSFAACCAGELASCQALLVTVAMPIRVGCCGRVLFEARKGIAGVVFVPATTWAASVLRNGLRQGLQGCRGNLEPVRLGKRREAAWAALCGCAWAQVLPVALWPSATATAPLARTGWACAGAAPSQSQRVLTKTADCNAEGGLLKLS